MTSPRPLAPAAGWALLSATLAPVALIGGWLLGAAIQPAGSYDAVSQTISVLAGHAATHRWLMTTALAVVGGCHLVTAAGLRGARLSARALLVVAGLAGIAVAFFAQPAHGSSAAHITSAGISMVALSVWPFVVAERSRPGLLGVRAGVAAGVVAVALLGWLAFQLGGGSWLGVAERAATAAQVLWPLVVAVALRRSAGRRSGTLAR